MTTYETYEIKAEAFRIMTGHMAPGKDAASNSYPESFEEREKLWEAWCKDNAGCIKAMLIAVDTVIVSD